MAHLVAADALAIARTRQIGLARFTDAVAAHRAQTLPDAIAGPVDGAGRADDRVDMTAVSRGTAVDRAGIAVVAWLGCAHADAGYAVVAGGAQVAVVTGLRRQRLVDTAGFGIALVDRARI